MGGLNDKALLCPCVTLQTRALRPGFRIPVWVQAGLCLALPDHQRISPSLSIDWGCGSPSLRTSITNNGGLVLCVPEVSCPGRGWVLFLALRLGPEWRLGDTAPHPSMPASSLGMPLDHPSHPNVHLT